MVVADEDSRSSRRAFETIASCYADHAIVADAFRAARGRLAEARRAPVLWRPAAAPSSYGAHLVDDWLPPSPSGGSRAGASVADIGC
jgi:hypothetical protein